MDTSTPVKDADGSVEQSLGQQGEDDVMKLLATVWWFTGSVDQDGRDPRADESLLSAAALTSIFGRRSPFTLLWDVGERLQVSGIQPCCCGSVFRPSDWHNLDCDAVFSQDVMLLLVNQGTDVQSRFGTSCRHDVTAVFFWSYLTLFFFCISWQNCRNCFVFFQVWKSPKTAKHLLSDYC